MSLAVRSWPCFLHVVGFYARRDLASQFVLDAKPEGHSLTVVGSTVPQGAVRVGGEACWNVLDAKMAHQRVAVRGWLCVRYNFVRR